MICLDKLNAEQPQIDGLPVLHDLALGCFHQIVLGKFILNDAHRQLGGIDRHVDVPDDIRERADMILMTVGDNKALHFVDIVFQIGDVRNHQVDSEHVVLRKGQTAVHHNNTVFELKGSYVHSDLLQTAERNDPQFGIVNIFQKNSPFFLQRNINVLQHFTENPGYCR